MGQWGFLEQLELGTSEVKRLPWARFLVEPALVVDVFQRVALTGGVGIGASWPLRYPDELKTERFNFIVSPALDVRLEVRSWISIVLQARTVFEEKTPGVRDTSVVPPGDIDGLADPGSLEAQQMRDSIKYKALSLLLLAGVQVSF